MKNKREMPLHFKYKLLLKRSETQDENLRNLLRLSASVHPSPVVHIDDVDGLDKYTTITQLANSRNYPHRKLRMLLEREGILKRKDGQWVFTDENNATHLCIYVTGYKKQYKRLYLLLTAEGVQFMLHFIETHPIKHHKPKTV